MTTSASGFVQISKDFQIALDLSWTLIPDDLNDGPIHANEHAALGLKARLQGPGKSGVRILDYQEHMTTTTDPLTFGKLESKVLLRDFASYETPLNKNPKVSNQELFGYMDYEAKKKAPQFLVVCSGPVK